ncbi:MAG: hypothetical protein LBJ00_16205 [Planctomycetaceae bacterium]|nr:hypothetical protein [Planctomycetaceae bacterium]
MSCPKFSLYLRRYSLRHCPQYTVAGRAIGFAREQPLHVVTRACSASRILK